MERTAAGMVEKSQVCKKNRDRDILEHGTAGREEKKTSHGLLGSGQKHSLGEKVSFLNEQRKLQRNLNTADQIPADYLN